ncbi:MAG: hypothetical protein IV086_04650 [Hyphomonadaceae bacterium]|nr:hypothetical protein [Hyphomonadaceae bacterium]
MRSIFLTIVAFLLVACASVVPPRPPLDAVAERFVKLTLEIGEREEGYVDAYHGPPEWAAEAKANTRSVEALGAEANALLAMVRAVPDAGLAPLELKRRAYLEAHLQSAAFRLRMIGGERAPFADEAEALFGVRPPLAPLESFEPAIARVDALLPGEGPLHARVAAFRKRYEIPADRVRPVMEAAIAECRRRTLAHIPLPASERFDLELVTGKPWGGYNWFKGGAHSLIQINTDLPSTIDRALDLGCHEGYPGHHVQNVLMEKLYTERGWVEFSIWPLFAPVGFIAEGSANAGIALAFPGDEKRQFEQRVLYPLAGLDPAAAPALEAVTIALAALRGAEYTIADAYLAGRIDRAGAIAQLQRYQLSSPERAAKRVDFIDAYRSYVINYGLGQDMVAARLARAGAGQDAQWAAMVAILSEPTLPAELEAR